MIKANIKERLLAFLIDLIIVSFLQGIAMLILLINLAGKTSADKLLNLIFLVTGISSLILFFKDIFKGVSLGKRIFKLAVRNIETYQVPSKMELLIRNITYILWMIDFPMYLFSKEKRRLGDNIANTDVYKINK